MKETKEMKAPGGPSALAQLAGAVQLKGKVCITDAKGVTHEYVDEAAAMAAWGGKVGSLEHLRGAFFERAAKPAAERKREPEEQAPKSKRGEK